MKICAPASEVKGRLESLRGVKKVEQGTGRDMDSTPFVIESERGVDVRKDVFALCCAKGWPIIGMEPYGTDLETVFIRLVDSSDGISTAKRKGR